MNAAKFSILFGRVERQSQAWWFSQVEKPVKERRKAFATALGSDEDQQAYNSTFRNGLSVIAKAKGEA